MGQVFALASDCDATQLQLTAAEGYLLSRFDGATPWRVLREMAGVPAEDADHCLARWLEEGFLKEIGGRESGATTSGNSATKTPRAGAVDSASASRMDAAEGPTNSVFAPVIDESQLDDELEIEIETQRRILEFEAGLDRPYHELLAVDLGSDPKVVKRAYFKLSKEFHPDRYFRRDIGSHGKRLEQIFKKILEAHEMLSDPELCQVQNQGSSSPAVAVALTASPEATGPSSSTVEKPKRLSKLERLKQRMPFKIDESVIEARRAKAQEIFRAAENSQQAGRLLEAEANIRIAISFDPARSEFKEALGSIRIQAAGASATKLLAKPSERMSDSELRDALKLLEDVLIYRPHDPELNERAARVSLRLGKLDLAHEYASTLVERVPEVASAHTLMGRIHREQNNLDAAMSAFECALKLDERDLEARRGLASLRLGARNLAQGGTA